MRLRVAILLCFFTFSVFGQTVYTVESVPNPQKAAVPSFVSDPDDILKPETELIINTQIDSLWKVNNTELAVVMLGSIGYENEDEFANRLYNHWGIGGKIQSNGVLLLVVMDIRRGVIRTGLGVEGILPDITTRRILYDVIYPEFKNEDYDAGVIAGVDAIIRTVREEPFEKEVREPIIWKEIIPYAAAGYIVFMLLIWFWINSVVRKVHQNNVLTTNLARYRAIRDQNKATYSLSGYVLPIIAFIAILFLTRFEYVLLLFPAPIAALPAYLYGKRQMKKARRAPIPCDACGSQMHILSEREEDKYLKISQQFEEHLKSVDYDVFLCDNCQNEAIFSLDKFNSYSNCPRCKTKAYILQSKRTVLMPTYINSGTERKIYKCKYCGFEDHKDIKIPKLKRSSGYFGGGFGGGVSSGSGGFGGGGFGGGMTGGGGASGGW